MRRIELEELEKKAAVGDRESLYLAGCARHDDDNLSLRDLDRAQRWLQLASEQGDARADRRLGYIHVVDLKDDSEGCLWYTRAAERGDAKAALSVGHLLGDRSARPHFYAPDRAAAWLEKALDGGERGAAALLGLVFLTRDFAGQDPWRGASLLEEASTFEFTQALRLLMRAQAAGWLVPVSVTDRPTEDAPPFPFRPKVQRLRPGLSLEELEREASNGVATARHDLGVLCYSDEVSAASSRAAAYRHFLPPAKAGLASAQFSLGCLAMTEPGLRDTRLALRMFSGAAGQGDVDAVRALEWLDAHRRLNVTPLPAAGRLSENR